MPFEHFGKIETLIEPKKLNFKNLNITNLVDCVDGIEMKTIMKPMNSGHMDYRGPIMKKVMEIIEIY